ncbi:MAG TPA: hypothetical protein VHB97_15780 [Polyangia bacterium]|jgi:hypothetical protein|nr:hypothetical protein [Polyangia bacterium]
MRESNDVLIDRPDLALANCDQICIAVPRGVANAALVREIRRGMEALAGRYGDKGIGLLFIVAETSSAPTGDARHEAGEMFDAMRPYLRVLSAQMEGSGFAAAAKRSVFTWATSKMLGKTPVKTFARLAEATAWLETKSAELRLPCPSRDTLEAVVRRIHPAK